MSGRQEMHTRLIYGEISALDRQGPFLAVPPSFAVKSFIPSIQSRFPVERPRQTDRGREGRLGDAIYGAL